jgi:hypothetical protein
MPLLSRTLPACGGPCAVAFYVSFPPPDSYATLQRRCSFTAPATTRWSPPEACCSPTARTAFLCIQRGECESQATRTSSGKRCVEIARCRRHALGTHRLSPAPTALQRMCAAPHPPFEPGGCSLSGRGKSGGTGHRACKRPLVRPRALFPRSRAYVFQRPAQRSQPLENALLSSRASAEADSSRRTGRARRCSLSRR